MREQNTNEITLGALQSAQLLTHRNIIDLKPDKKIKHVDDKAFQKLKKEEKKALPGFQDTNVPRERSTLWPNS